MQAFLVTTGIVALAEMGDKTQLLSLLLAARFRRPIPIIAGILAATLANHAGAGALGAWLPALIGMRALAWILAVSFLAMAFWTLIPDKADEAPEDSGRMGIFWTTTVAFFLAEMGDKTQLATVALAARYHAFLPIVAGSTLGMLLANAPVVYLGERVSRALPLKWIRLAAAAIFAGLGVAALWGALRAG
jgi:putative Ca2+/H+ antiporter (TMEM165/GDT1 family)